MIDIGTSRNANTSVCTNVISGNKITQMKMSGNRIRARMRLMRAPPFVWMNRTIFDKTYSQSIEIPFTGKINVDGLRFIFNSRLI